MSPNEAENPELRFFGAGIDKYSDYPHLPGARLEAETVADLLAARGARTVVADGATETALRQALKDALPRDSGSGALVVLWAGHGERAPDAGLRLIGPDGVRNDTPVLTAEAVASVAARSGSTQILLIFDACFSGGGVVSALTNVDAVMAERVNDQSRVWLGVLTSAMDWEKARDDLFGDRLIRLLRDGPSSQEQQFRWDSHNATISGDDLIQALLCEWDDNASHRPKTAQSGWYRDPKMLPNPMYNATAPPQVVEHLLMAARGGEPEDEKWYFAGRHRVIEQLVGWIRGDAAGLHVVTGPAGCGKSAVLGMVVCMSAPQQRKSLLGAGQLQYADPGENSIHAHVYARGLARQQLVGELDHQLSDAGAIAAGRRGRRSSGELLEAVAASSVRPVVVIDGLDEAGGEAWAICHDLLRELSGHALVLVGTRDLPPVEDGPGLVSTLQPDDAGVVQMLQAVDDNADVHAYVLQRLASTAATSEMDPMKVAAAILELPRGQDEGLFLLARMVTTQLRNRPIDTNANNWQHQMSGSVEDALTRDLDALPARTRADEEIPSAGRELLAALASGLGGGLPDDLWAVVATAVSPSGTHYDKDDVYWAATVAGRHVVVDGEAGRAVYRLSHQRIAQHLRSWVARPHRELRIAKTLVSTYLELLIAGVGVEENPYLWRYTWRHCADAGPAGIDQFRRLVEFDQDNFLPELAFASAYLTSKYEAENQLLSAVAPAEEAVTSYRELAADNPAYQPDLAMALNNLGIRYSEVGRRQEAVAPTEEAVTSYRQLAADNPAYRPDLAMALNNLGIGYSEVGRRQEAVAPTEEAVTLRREQAADNPAYRPDLAMALNNLGIRYSEVGRRQEAVAPTEEAVTLRREQAADNPAYRPDLAMALTNLGNRYSQLGRHAEAVAPTEEAVTSYRQLAADNPAYRPDLAMALSNLGSLFSGVGRRAEAVAPTEEAVTSFRQLAADNPAHRPNLAKALTNLGSRYSQLGRHAEAVAPTEEAVTSFRQLTADNPAHRPNLAMALNNLGVGYSGVGRRAEAVAPTEEAAASYRQLTADNPAHRPDLAMALTNLGSRYREVGRHAEAVAPTEEAVTLRREQAADNPAYRRYVAGALDNLTKCVRRWTDRWGR